MNYNYDTIFTFSENIVNVWTVYRFTSVSIEILCYSRKSPGRAIKIAVFKSNSFRNCTVIRFYNQCSFLKKVNGSMDREIDR